MDRAYTVFGGFPSSSTLEVGLAPMLCHHMGPLFAAVRHRSASMLINVVQAYCDRPILDLEDDDFRYLLAIFDKVSYTEDTRVVEWRCHHPKWTRGSTGDTTYDHVYTDPHDPRYVQATCDTLNTQSVHYRLIRGARRKLPDGMRYPIIRTMVEAERAEGDGYPADLLECARWVKSDWPLREIADSLTMAEVAEIRKHMHTTMRVERVLKCSFCPNRETIVDDMDIFGFLRVYSDMSMLNMQFNLSTFFNAEIGESAPIKRLLYHHGCYIKDLKEAEKQKRLRESKRGRT